MAAKKGLPEIQEEVLKMLKEKLPPELSYHSYDHTIDVLQATERIANSEKVSGEELFLLKTAAIFHDTGYIYARENHEQESCTIARKILLQNGTDESTIEKICSLILATIYPYKPKNKLEEIICDADLDYLGRDDYFRIAERVYREFRHFGVVSSEEDWKNMQIRFLGSHRYFTDTSNKLRRKKKEENLKMIEDGLVPK